MKLAQRRQLLDEEGIARALRTIADEIVARHHGVAETTALVGIRTGGLLVAERLRAILGGEGVPLGAIDIALYRDDVLGGLPRPAIGRTELPFELKGRTIVLVDDVLYTGRTVRAALDALVDYGRPRAVQLAVLVDRGHRELPIQPDYVGLRVETAARERVRVHLRPHEETERVVVYEQVGA